LNWVKTELYPCCPPLPTEKNGTFEMRGLGSRRGIISQRHWAKRNKELWGGSVKWSLPEHRGGYW